MKPDNIPPGLKETIDRDIQRGYTQIETTLFQKRLKTRKPQSPWLHIILFITTIGIGNITYMLLNELQSQKYKIKKENQPDLQLTTHQALGITFLAIPVLLFIVGSIAPNNENTTTTPTNTTTATNNLTNYTETITGTGTTYYEWTPPRTGQYNISIDIQPSPQQYAVNHATIQIDNQEYLGKKLLVNNIAPHTSKHLYKATTTKTHIITTDTPSTHTITITPTNI